jgi:putative nucleotidyltransferase with HDIG domain
MPNLESLLQQSDELPSLPEIYIKVSDLLEDEESTSKEIGQAVQTDPSLTARILKLINSAYYGMPRQVTSVAQAVSLLGRLQLKQILLGTLLAGVFNDMQIRNFSMMNFWRHSIKTAIIARHLAMQNVNIIDHEAFFTAGLLHDIGRLVMAKAAPDELAEIDRQVRNGGDVIKLEAELLGLTHVDVGGALMLKWDMPAVITQCVLKHHCIEHEGEHAIPTSIVYLANKLSEKPVVETEKEMQGLLSGIRNWKRSENTLDQILIACQLADQQWAEVMESLGMVDMEIADDFAAPLDQGLPGFSA